MKERKSVLICENPCQKIRPKADKFRDRNIEIMDERVAEFYRKKTGKERLKIAFDMWDFAKNSLTHYLKSIHCDWDEEKVKNEVARRLSHGAT
jgi:hypothetical protein